jgi:hypothetical protein
MYAEPDNEKELIKRLEPTNEIIAILEDRVSVSTAISLKRIADAMESLNAVAWQIHMNGIGPVNLAQGHEFTPSQVNKLFCVICGCHEGAHK